MEPVIGVRNLKVTPWGFLLGAAYIVDAGSSCGWGGRSIPAGSLKANGSAGAPALVENA